MRVEREDDSSNETPPGDGADGTTARPGPRRGRRVAAGAAGLAAALGAGAFLLTQQTTSAPAPDVAARAQVATSTEGTTPAGASAAASPSPAASSATAAPTASPSASGKRAKAPAAASDGKEPAPRKLTKPVPAKFVSPDAVTVRKSGSLAKGGQIMRVASARQDLTGYRELAWVVDAGKKVGNAHCTQRVKLTRELKPKVRPTLLLCWRTSATKSVYTVLVDIKKKPSAAQSVAEINRVWDSLS